MSQKNNKETKKIKYGKCIVECICGNKFETSSIKEIIKVEICSNCHPFYTGKHKLVDTAGRVDKFKEKIAKAQKYASSKIEKNKKKKSINKNEKKEK